MAFGAIVTATIGCGAVIGVDDAAAKAAPGVKPGLGMFDLPTGQGEAGAKAYVQGQAVADLVFVNPKVRYFGQPVALVVADTLENARTLRQGWSRSATARPSEFVFDPAKATPTDADHDSRIGDFEVAFTSVRWSPGRYLSS